MMKYFLWIIAFVLVGCHTEVPTKFSEKALLDKVTTIDKDKITFGEVLKKYKGQKVVVDFWASWCGDCIRGMPKMVALQKEYKDVVYVFIAVDESYKSWKKGITKYRIEGEHYLLPSGWDGDLGAFIDLDWIPRYMIVGENGAIDLFEAVKANDERIIEALKK